MAGGTPRCPARPLAGEAPCEARATSLAFGRCGVVLAAQITGGSTIFPSTVSPHLTVQRVPHHHPINSKATPCRSQVAAAPSHQLCSNTIPQAPLPHRAEHKLQQHHPISSTAAPCRAKVAATLDTSYGPRVPRRYSGQPGLWPVMRRGGLAGRSPRWPLAGDAPCRPLAGRSPRWPTRPLASDAPWRQFLGGTPSRQPAGARRHSRPISLAGQNVARTLRLVRARLGPDGHAQ